MVPPNPRFSRNVPTKIAMLAGDVLNFGTCHLGLHFFWGDGISGWWFQSLRKILVNGKDYPI